MRKRENLGVFPFFILTEKLNLQRKYKNHIHNELCPIKI